MTFLGPFSLRVSDHLISSSSPVQRWSQVDWHRRAKKLKDASQMQLDDRFSWKDEREREKNVVVDFDSFFLSLCLSFTLFLLSRSIFIRIRSLFHLYAKLIIQSTSICLSVCLFDLEKVEKYHVSKSLRCDAETLTRSTVCNNLGRSFGP